jgi:peroxiredoxin
MKQIIAALFFLSAIAFSADPKSLKIGDDAPSFTLKNYDGKEYSLPKVLKENKFAVLMFMSTQCPVSNGYNDRMEQLYEEYSKQGVAVIGINANKEEDMASIAAHAKKHGFKFPILKDERNKVADLYGAQVTPETYVMAPSGKLVYHGRIDDSQKAEKVKSHDLADALTKLLAGKEPAIAQSKAFGCSIKRIVTD